MKITRDDGWMRCIEYLGVFLSVVAIVFVFVVDTTHGMTMDGITAVMTALTVLFVYMAWKQTRYAAEDAERPHISIILRMTSGTDRILEITNTGKSTAIGTKLTLVGVRPGLRVRSQETENGEVYYLDETPLFTQGCDLPSEWLYEFLLPDGPMYANDPDENEYARKFDVHVSYESLSKTHYEDTIPIDIGAHRHSIVPGYTSAQRIELLTKELIPVLKDISRGLGSIRGNR